MKDQLLNALSRYVNAPIQRAGEYWSEDNARFEAGNPGLGDRALRAINPMTSFGSAMGAMRDGASAGSARDMGLAFLQALPLFGALRAVGVPAQGLSKATTVLAPSAAKTVLLGAGSTSAAVAADEAQAREARK